MYMNEKIFMITLVALVIFIGCNDSQTEEKQIAEKYCSSCHLFPEASLLDKSIWTKSVLPVMRRKLLEGGLIGDSLHNNATRELISSNDWQKIVDYYQENAPDSPTAQVRPPVKNITDRFITKKVFSADSNSSITYVKIDEGNKWIYAANALDSSLNIYSDQLHLLSKKLVHQVIVDMNFTAPLENNGERNGILTNIGIMNPNDLKTGTADSFHIATNCSLSYLRQVLNNMPRPVQTSVVDFNNDGMKDYLVCGFGNNVGALYWMKNKGNNLFEQNIIRALPGAVKAYIDDYNHDGLPDIMVLMAQAQEGIYLFINKGNGSFETKNILQFPPVYGSSYFELDDFNNDGYKDILYTCGDNEDFSIQLKNFHGVYIFLNDGKGKYVQKYFFPIHGCYRAIARDFDNDGDLDIATISFFPDVKNQPQEAFVYLENKANKGNSGFQFEPYTINEVGEGNWLTMDAGDADGDGDVDIVLGSFTHREEVSRQKKAKPSFLFLENKTIVNNSK